MPKDPYKLSPFKLKIVELIASILPPCDVTCQRLSAGVDEKLSLYERVMVRLHMANCFWCTNFKIQTDFIAGALRSGSEPAKGTIPLSQKLSPENKDQIQHFIEKELGRQS